jgi:hypothetical protein
LATATGRWTGGGSAGGGGGSALGKSKLPAKKMTRTQNKTVKPRVTAFVLIRLILAFLMIPDMTDFRFFKEVIHSP